MKKSLSKKLASTRSQISKRWQTYQRNKKKILKQRLTEERKSEKISELFFDTKAKVSKQWQNYGKYRYQSKYKSRFYGLQLKNRVNIKSGYIKDYKVDTLKGITKFSKNEKELSKIRYIVVILKIYLPETETFTFISDSFTPEAFRNKTGTEIQGLVIDKFKALESYEGFELRNVYLKIIYK